MRIIAVGDIMPGGLLSITNSEFATKEVRDFLRSGDLRVGNFECAIEIPNPSGKKYSAGGNTIYIKEKDVFRVRDLGFNVVSIANNHVFDLGPEGAYKVMEVLDKMGIEHCGAGHNLDEARKPVVVHKDGKSYAFLAFSDTSLKYMYEATADSPGVNPLSEENVTSEIRKASAQFDYVIVIPHWGVEYTLYPSFQVERLSKLMVAAGADLILGGHPHRVQSIVKSKHYCVAYSLGNFLFPNRIINKPRFTWYPESDGIDFSKLPQVIGKCPPVYEPTIKKWYPCAYSGLILVCSFEDGCLSINTKSTLLDENGCVGFHNKSFFIQRSFLSCLALVIKMDLYWPFYAFFRVIRKCRSLFK